MSSPESRQPTSSSSAEAAQTSPRAPKRPNHLVHPPRRPASDGTSAGNTGPTSTATPPDVPAPDSAPALSLPQPISPPSEPRQYRAIGLVKGTYRPSEEQFNRGNVVTENGTEIDSVLLGRVTSLVKKHIDLEAPHLWVVYPRTRQDEKTQAVDLHLQIVGVWEPETLGLPGESPGDVEGGDVAETEAAHQASDDTPENPADDPQENYFSIRGEVIKYEDDEDYFVVKILQGANRDDMEIKAFRLHVAGTLPSAKTVGYFWDLEIERQEKSLVMQSSQLIGIVPPKKRKKAGKRDNKGRKPTGGIRRGTPSPKSKPRTRPMAPVKSNPL